ncbi:MAG: tetratricopeptide repeat protein, partial [Acidobacteria bacterium]|nr:tetratricopeptide repeat protein [Acidobacteriota bacterium]
SSCVLMAILALQEVALVQAAPYIPQDDAQILEQLPRSAGPIARELRGLREEIARQPDNLELAITLARRYIAIGRAESDPRYFGYAQAALQPWWDRPEPPAQVLVLRATLRQNRHDFEAALDDLAKALAQDPRNVQAWLTRAVILEVQGRYPEALRSCLPLMNLADTLLATACLSSAASLSSQAAKSYELLLKTLESSKTPNPEVRLWALTVLAEIAVRMDDPKAAEQHFKEALALGSRDAYALSAYADLLLDQRRFEEVEALLRDETRIDGLLLRLALSERELGSAQFPEHLETLKARFAASRKRGDTVHQGEEARFTLHLLRKPREALRLAQANWAVQREPRDARILLEAALATQDPAAAQPVLEMLKHTALEDVKLRRLAARIEEIR